MICYDLICEREHPFESWFRNSAAFDQQAAGGGLACPVCGSTRVAKRLMTPGLPVRANRREPPPPAIADAKARAVREAMNRLRQHVEATADYVGAEFPDEARRIYYKESEERGIYGEASLDEARELHEEGIEVLPLPPAPNERN
jgi:hypothetical protein